MSFPNIPNITPLISVTTAQVVPLLLASIALEELSLAHIMNAEAEKLQLALGTLTGSSVTLSPATVSLTNLLDVDTSVQRTLRDVIKKEILLEFKFENVLDLIPTIPVPPVPPSCPSSVTLSNGATVQFTGLTNGGLTWNYQITVPTTPSSFVYAPIFPCAITSFIRCRASSPVVCFPVNRDLCDQTTQPGILYGITTFTQSTINLSFTLNQQFPIGTIRTFFIFSNQAVQECFNICGPMCS